MISILNYGMGNIGSIQNALNYLKVESQIIDSSDQIIDCEKLILPGVGSFNLAMKNIKDKGFLDPLNKIALKEELAKRMEGS